MGEEEETLESWHKHIKNIMEVDQSEQDTKDLVKGVTEDILKGLETIIEAGATPKVLFGLKSKIEREIKVSVKESNPDKFRLSKELGKSAYTYQIDNACKPTVSLTQAAIEHDEDISTVLHAGVNDKWRYNGLMVEVHEQFFNGKTLSVPTEDLKISVKKASTLGAGLNRVFSFQKHEAEIAELRQRADYQEKLIEQLTFNQVITNIDVEWIKEVSGWEVSDKDKAIALRDKGATYKVIGEMLGKSESTIKRWLKEL